MKNFGFILPLLFLISCGENTNTNKKLPLMGRHQEVNGDTIFYQIPEFSFVDQDSNMVSTSTVQGKVYVADFFFTTCPTICKRMTAQMLRVHDEFLDEDSLVLLSHTIDPKHDSVSVLKAYADKISAQTSKWHFLTGDQDTIFSMAKSYMVSALKDEKNPELSGGYIHSGAFILLDKNRHIRGYYDGTSPDEVDQMMTDIRTLLKES